MRDEIDPFIVVGEEGRVDGVGLVWFDLLRERERGC